MNFNIDYQGVASKWHNYRKWVPLIQQSTHQVLENKQALNRFSLILVSSDNIQELNRDYRNIDRPTDVLTFVDEDEEDYLGDIFVNVDAVENQAKDYGHSKKREFCFLVTHGLLHLLGYDHQDEVSEKEMFTLQEKILHDIAPRHK